MENLEHLRHSLAHLLAAAVLELYPDAKQAIGPAIENGFYYDFEFPSPISDDDLSRIEEKMRAILKTWDKFERIEVKPQQAREMFSGNPYKLELIDEYTDQGLTLYKSGPPAGGYIDLCRGGHINSAKEINPDAFKLTHIAGAYWRGSEKNKMLTRIYGIAFETKEELDKHLEMLEKAKKRDHRILGKTLEIYTTADEVGPGLILWLPKGTIIRQELEKWALETEKKWGYQHVSTPHITKGKLYEISGHLPYFKDDLYAPFEIDGEAYYLKPMNCPHTHMIYKSQPRSYRDLPVRYSEYGQVYRYERSGTLHGLMRTRGFCQNDAHIYVQPELAVEEFMQVFKLHQYYYDTLGIKDWWVVLGIRDPKNLRAKYHGDDAMWAEAEKLSREALDKSGIHYEVEEGGGAHYGPKADIYICSVIGKEYAIGTDQLDLYMPVRFNLKYVDKDGSEKTPYIIHRAPLGSHERMIGFLLEHYAGAFPVWLSPVQVVVAPVSNKFDDWAHQVRDELIKNNMRVEINDTSETLGKKIRDAETQKIPYLLVIGEKEVKAKSVAVRQRGTGDIGAMKLDEFKDFILKQIQEKK